MLELAARPGYSVNVIRCASDHPGWSAAEVSPVNRMVLVRRGRFRRRVRGTESHADPTAAYFVEAGEEESFAHPAGEDVCTTVDFGEGLWRRLAGEGPWRSSVYVDGALELAHRRLVASTADPGYALAEQLLVLVGHAVSRATTTGAGPSDRGLVERAREAIVADVPAAVGLFPLAEWLGVSPYRLSRAFPRELGVSLTRYRNRVRVGRALERLEAGERELAVLAAELGFADQAHLTRTVREHAGAPPGVVRRLLAE